MRLIEHINIIFLQSIRDLAEEADDALGEVENPAVQRAKAALSQIIQLLDDADDQPPEIEMTEEVAHAIADAVGDKTVRFGGPISVNPQVYNYASE